MEKSELWKKGDAVRTEMFGQETVDRLNRAGTYDHPIMEMFGDYVREAVFGTLWTRPGIDVKLRTLICVITDTATHAHGELALHLRMARRQGWTEEELSEVFLHMGAYLGVPVVRQAMLIAKTVFAEMRAEEAAGKKV